MIFDYDNDYDNDFNNDIDLKIIYNLLSLLNVI